MASRGGVGTRGSDDLPKYQQVQARISNSYSIERIGTSETGFGLQSSLTPAATETERWRARHFAFACLAQGRGCGETCEVMPDAWRDFYEKRGRFKGSFEQLPGRERCGEKASRSMSCGT
jgi:hypothetical protein